MLTRRDFLKVVGVGSAATAALTVMAACSKGGDNAVSGGEAATNNSPVTENTPSVTTPTGGTGSMVAEDTGYNGKINIVVGQVGSDFGGISPHATSTGLTFKNYIFERLFVRDGYGGSLASIMVDNIEKVAACTYHVKLAENIYDSDGNHFTADDAVFSYEHARDCGTVTKMYYMAEISKVDEFTVELVTSSEDLGVYENIFSSVNTFTKAAWEGTGNEMATEVIGTGPYAMTDFVNGSHMTLTKREDYWKTEDIFPYLMPKVDSLTFQMIADVSALAVALETGEIDCISGVTGGTVDYFVNEDGTAKAGYNVYSVVNSLVPGLFFNMDIGSPFEDNLKLRQAILYCFDSQDFVDACLDGKGTVCHAFASEIYGDYLEKWKDEDYYEYDFEKAQQLLSESGFQQKSPFRILCQSSAPFNDYAQLLGAYLYALGLEYEILAYDSTLYNDCKYDSGKWDMKIDQCKSPDILPNIWNYCFNWANYENYGTNFIHDEYFQELLKLIATEDGHNDENLDACHRYMTDNAWVYALCDPYIYYISKDTVNMSVLDDTFYPISCTVNENFVPIAK